MPCRTAVGLSSGNCGAPTTKCFDDLRLLDTAVDWKLQRTDVMWNNSADDPNRATRRGAELLVHRHVPWHVIRWLVARTPATAAAVRDILDEAGSSHGVFVRPGWYFNGEKYR